MSDPIPQTHQGSIKQCITFAKMHSEGRLGPSAKKIFDDFSSVMALLWDALAKMTAAALPSSLEVKTDCAHPGYVFISEEDTSYAVPFFLAELFPKGKQLAELKELSKKIRVGRDSTVCLSGSGCSVGAQIPVADIDFCEYLVENDVHLPQRLVSATKTETDQLLCLRVTLSQRKIWRRPWGSDLEKPSELFFRQTLKKLQKSKSKKVDYLAQTNSFGVLEVTNKLLFLDFAYPETGEGRYSFPMQEVPLGDATWVPRSLANPIEVGRYVIWLFEEVRHHLEKSLDEPRSSIKALRRAMPLSRILMAEDEMKELYQLLTDENGARLAALYDRCALFAGLKDHQLKSTYTYAEGLSRSIHGLRSPEDYGEPLTTLSAKEQEALQSHSMKVRTVVGGMIDILESRVDLAL